MDDRPDTPRTPIAPQPGTSNDSVAGAPSDNTTMTAVLSELEADGYTASFGARDGARLQCSACRSERPVADFDVHATRRFEGASDPDAEAILVAGACPNCGAKGTAVFGYGPEASEADSLAVMQLDVR